MHRLAPLRWIGCCLALALSAAVQPVAAVTPESPEVKALIEKGLAYLNEADHSQPGGKCLMALAFKKNGRDNDHPKVKEAIAVCNSTPIDDHAATDNYNLGLMIIFLCEMEDEAYRPRIQKMLTELYKRQNQAGAWGYPGNVQGDTSQTQYGVLAVWIAERHGHDVPLPVIEKCINWILRTQDPSGAWGYQGNDPGNGPLQSQSPLTMSLTSAALGSLYILSDLVNMPGYTRAVDNSKDGSKLPTALQEVEDKRNAQSTVRRRNTSTVDGARVRQTMDRGKQWLKKNFTLHPEEFKYYAFYAFERFESFREVLERDTTVEPKWYNDIYGELQKSVSPQGAWESGDIPASATSFAVLVLCRSTRKAIKRAEALGEGILLGGMGLPPNTADLKERNGKLVDTPLGGSVDEILNLLEDEDNPELLRLADSKQVVTLDPDITKRAGQITRLRNMVSAGAYEKRIVAVRSLAKVRDLDNVPVLLYALTDPDIRVVREADKGLRFISRKLSGVVSLDAPTKETLAALRTKWKEWFLSIKPDGELLD